MSLTKTSPFAEMQKLVQEAEQIEMDAKAKQSEIMARMRDLANSNAGEYQLNGNGDTAIPALPKKKRTKATKATKVKVVKKTGKKGKGKKTGGLSLKAAVLECVSNKKLWEEHLDLPPRTKGLQPSDVKTIIEKSGMWSSTSKNISNQLSQELYKLRVAGEITRDETTRRYSKV